MPEAVEAPVVPAAPKFEIPVLADQTVETMTEGEKSAQDTGTEATPAKPEAKPEEVTPDVAAKREGRRFERRLDKAYRERATQEARAVAAEKRLAELEKAQAPKIEGEPKLEQYDFDPEKYGAAKAEFAKKQTEKEFQAKQQSESHKQYQQKLTAGWDEKVDKAEEKYPDWRDKVGDIQPNTPFTAAIFEAENGADIAYYLGDNPKEAMRIARLPPLSQVREIGKLEAKLLAEPVKPKTPSKAPAPITPLSGAAVTVTDVPSEADDYPVWLKKRQKQVHAKR